MEKEIIRAYDFAEKEIKKEKEEQLKNKIKDIVQETLEKIERIEKEEKELAEEKKILKQDIDNLKSGRLDLIEERQNKNSKARDASIFKVKTKKIEYPPNNSIYSITATSTPLVLNADSSYGFNTTGYISATYTCGTYNLNGGNIKSL